MNGNQADKCRETLLMGYPKYSDLGDFPLGELLRELDVSIWTTHMRHLHLDIDILDNVTAKYSCGEITLLGAKELLYCDLFQKGLLLSDEYLNDIYRFHILKCFQGIKELVESPVEFCKMENKNASNQSFLNMLRELAGDKKERILFNLIILYHDIGKVFHRDKHAQLGKHILENSTLADKKGIKMILQSFKEDRIFYDLLEIIGHHDLFGTLCTGEASTLALIDAVGLTLRTVKESEYVLNHLVLVNLADAFGTVALSSNIIENIINDWMKFKDDLNMKSNENRFTVSDIEDKITLNEQNARETIKRIGRLLFTGISENDTIKEQFISLMILNKGCL